MRSPRFTQPRGEKSLNYWKRKLEIHPPVHFPRDKHDHSSAYISRSQLTIVLPEKLAKHFRHLCLNSKGNVPRILLAVLNTLLYRYTGQGDICVGCIFQGADFLPDGNDLYCNDAGLVPIRTTVSGSLEFSGLVDSLSKEIDHACRFPIFPEEFEESEIGMIAGETGLITFPLVFNYIDSDGVEQAGDDDMWHQFPGAELIFTAILQFDSIQLSIRYSDASYLEGTIRRMMKHYLSLLGSAIKTEEGTCGGLEMLDQAESDLILNSFNNSLKTIPTEHTVIHLFEERVKLNPDSVALVYDSQAITYADLHEESNKLAFFLRESGVAKEDIVPICLERSLELAIAILAVLKANAAFVPIDPELPSDRIAYMLADSKSSLAIASSKTKAKIAGNQNLILVDKLGDFDWAKGGPQIAAPLPQQLCYVIYTSGTTGKPKGVMIEHQNLVNFLLSMAEDVEFTAESTMLSVTTYSFDIFYLELFLPLIAGGKVHIASRETSVDGFKLAKMIQSVKPSHMQATPSGWQLLLDAGWENSEQVKMLVGGEALKEAIKSELTGIGTLWNLYGPTETTIWSTFKKLQKSDKITIGKPIANTSIYILNKDLGLNPIGVPGELFIGGKGVGRGYLNRPDLTQERFISNPYSNGFDSRIYKTGDLAVWLPNGEIECLGRIDDQIKIRGYRIECGEIESVIHLYPPIRQAAVVAKEDPTGTKRLVAYVVAEEGFVREHAISILQEKLPEYMVPMIWARMDKLPLTFNGKINKKELPEPSFESAIKEGFVPASSGLERSLADIWCKVLDIREVGIHNNFFSLGGHSLAAMRVIAMVRREMDLELKVSDFFDSPTIATLIEKLAAGGSSFQPPKDFQINQPMLPSFSQESLWFIDRLKGSAHYHLPLVLKIEGDIEAPILEQTILAIIERQGILKSSFFEHEGSVGLKTIDPVVWNLELHDVSDFSTKLTVDELNELISKIIYRPFDQESDLKIRASLIKTGRSESVLVLTLHHIIADGWSMNILKKEISIIYGAIANGNPVTLPSLPIQFSQYAAWQKQTFSNEWIEREMPYWLEKLDNLESLQMPTDFPRPRAQSTSGGMVRFNLDQNLTETLVGLGHKHGATLFMTLLSAFKVLLHRYTGQEDLCIGTPVAGREMPEFEDLLGFFINSVPIRTIFSSEMTYLELLENVKANVLEAFEHRNVPFEKIVEAKSEDRDLSINPIFQSMFVLQNMPETKISFPNVKASEIPYFHQSAVLDFTFELTHLEGTLEGKFEYSSDLFTRETAERIVSHYLSVLRQITLEPSKAIGRMELIGEMEKEIILKNFHPHYRHRFTETSVVEMLEEIVRAKPNETAVEFEGRLLSYAELDNRSSQLAHYLRSLGKGKESKVPICLDRSFEMIVGIWGILKAGAAYVPIDPSYPPSRIELVLEDIETDCILTNTKGKESIAFPDSAIVLDLEGDWDIVQNAPTLAPFENPDASDLAYIIYTSGSTGLPKGVMIEHKSLSTLILSRRSHYHGAYKSILVPSFGFDASVLVIFGTLLSGGKLILCTSEEIKNPRSIQNLFNETEELVCVPSYYKYLLDEEILNFTSLKRVILGGERLDENLAKRHFEVGGKARLFNEYGPTEASVLATIAEILPSTKQITIGRPIENTRIYIVGKNGGIQPIGIPGEVWIAGPGVSRGYLKRPELNQERFETDSFMPDENARMYHTGDVAKWLPDGTIDYVGRLDNQIKLRGFRVELGEIESALNSLPGVKDSVVVLSEGTQGEKLLLAYIVDGEYNQETENGRIRKLRDTLKDILPEYMVPNGWVFLESLPLTANNKIDRKNLPKPRYKGKADLLPLSPNEMLIAKIWATCLRNENIDLTSDFFELGGHSLLAVKVISMLEAETGIRYPLNSVFKYPLLREFGNFMDEFKPDNAEWSALVPIKVTGTKTPLYLVHGIGSSVSIFFNLAKYISDDQPIYGFQPIGLNGVDSPNASLKEMAAHYVAQMVNHNPNGPYLIGGYSFGGYVAIEMARQLLDLGRCASKILIFDTPANLVMDYSNRWDKFKYYLKDKFVDYFVFSFHEPRGFLESKMRSLDRAIDDLLERLKIRKTGNPNDQSQVLKSIVSNNRRILDDYRLSYYPGTIYLFRAPNRNFYIEDSLNYGWKKYLDEVIVVPVTGHHDNFFKESKHLEVISRQIQLTIEGSFTK